MKLHLDIQFTRQAFSLQVQADLASDMIGILGDSACGKTTLLHVLAGLLKPDRGTVCFDRQVLCDTQKKIHVSPHCRQMGVVFQEGRLFPHMTVEENVRYGMKGAGRVRGGVTVAGDIKGSVPFTLDQLLNMTGLETLRQRYPSALSGGQQRRVAIARAIACHPRLLLLDEPFAGLDYAATQQLIGLLGTLRERLHIPMLLVSHHLSRVLQLTEELLLLEAGRVVGVGRYHDLVQQRSTLEPLLAGGLVNILPMRIGKRDAAAGCMVFESENGKLQIQGPICSLEAGSLAHLSIGATEVAIALNRVPDISIRNQIRGVIRRRIERHGLVVLEIDVGLALLAEVSTGSARRMRLDVGREVWCLVKANAVTVLAPRPEVILTSIHHA